MLSNYNRRCKATHAVALCSTLLMTKYPYTQKQHHQKISMFFNSIQMPHATKKIN